MSRTSQKDISSFFAGGTSGAAGSSGGAGGSQDPPDSPHSNPHSDDDMVVVGSSSDEEGPERPATGRSSTGSHGRRSGTGDRDRSRPFQPQWLRLYPWLKVVQDTAQKKSVTCTYCKDAKARTPWAAEKPMVEWRITAFKYHEDNDRKHQAAVIARMNRPKKKIEATLAAGARKAEKGVERVMRGVLFAIQSRLPLMRATNIHQFVGHIGNLDDNPGIISLAHQSNYSTYQFVDAIQNAQADDDYAKLRKSFFALHVDESTDITVEKHLMMYTTTCTDLGDVETTFVACLKVDASTATVICDTITQFFKDHDIDLQNHMVQFTSDGASVMLGRLNGVAKLLRVDNGVAHLLDYHCVAHREALAMKDVMKMRRSAKSRQKRKDSGRPALQVENTELFCRAEDLMKDVVAWLSTQTIRRSLRSICDVLGKVYLSPRRIYEIRWLRRGEVVTTFLRMLEPILTALQSKADDGSSVAQGLLEKVSDYEFLLTIATLADILQPLQKLALRFQRNVVHPADVEGMVDSAVGILRDNYIDTYTPGQFASDLEADAQEGGWLSRFLKPGTFNADTTDLVHSEATYLVHLLKTALKLRLCDNDEILRCFTVFKPNPQMLDFTAQERVDFGKEEITILGDHYSELLRVDGPALLAEWEEFKNYVVFKEAAKPDCEVEWNRVPKFGVQSPVEYPFISKLCRILLTFNAQNAIVERGFSISHSIKSKARSRLLASTLDKLMRVTLNTEPYPDYNYAPAYEHWLSATERGRYNVGVPCVRQAPGMSRPDPSYAEEEPNEAVVEFEEFSADMNAIDDDYDHEY